MPSTHMWEKRGQMQLKLLTWINLKPVNGELNDTVNQAKGKLWRKWSNIAKTGLRLQKKNLSDSDVDGTEGVDDMG